MKLINYFTEVIIQFPPPASQIYLQVAPSLSLRISIPHKSPSEQLHVYQASLLTLDFALHLSILVF